MFVQGAVFHETAEQVLIANYFCINEDVKVNNTLRTPCSLLIWMLKITYLCVFVAGFLVKFLLVFVL